MAEPAKRRWCCGYIIVLYFILPATFVFARNDVMDTSQPTKQSDLSSSSTFSSFPSSRILNQLRRKAFSSEPDYNKATKITPYRKGAAAAAAAYPGEIHSNGGGAAPSSSSPGRLIRKRRQVDPLHSCIEAKCSGWRSSNYLDCIYHHCILSSYESSQRFGRDVRRFDRPSDRPSAANGGPAGALFPISALLARKPVPERRRGFNDVLDICKEQKCGPYVPSVDYFACIENISDCPSMDH